MATTDDGNNIYCDICLKDGKQKYAYFKCNSCQLDMCLEHYMVFKYYEPSILSKNKPQEIFVCPNCYKKYIKYFTELEKIIKEKYDEENHKISILIITKSNMNQ